MKGGGSTYCPLVIGQLHLLWVGMAKEWEDLQKQVKVVSGPGYILSLPWFGDSGAHSELTLGLIGL